MNDQALARYLKTCCRRLNQQQTALINDFGLRTCGAINVQQELGSLNLDLPGRGRAIATITPIARYSPSSQAWCWTWAESEPFPLHGRSVTALQLRSLAQKTGLELFAQARLKLSCEQTSLLLAMACSSLKASGYYRWRWGDEFIFLAVNHMALATAPLKYSSNGDRLKLTQLNGADKQGLTQVSQLVQPSPSLLGHSPTTPTWPSQQFIEGLFVHTLCQNPLSELTDTLMSLKSLHGEGFA